MLKMNPTTSPYINIKKSRIHNKGIYARKDIPKNTKIIEYVGEKLTKAKSDKRADVPLEKHGQNPHQNGAVYIFELNKKYDVDGDVPWNTAKFINHSCEPNCEVDIIKGKIYIIALENIKKGEELSYNYGYDFDDYEDHKCYCGSPRCVGYIMAEEFWPKLRAQKRRKNEFYFL